jgi:hypothetical protein
MTTTINPVHRIIPAVSFSQVVTIAGDFPYARKKTPEDPLRRSLFHIVSDRSYVAGSGTGRSIVVVLRNCDDRSRTTRSQQQCCHCQAPLCSNTTRSTACVTTFATRFPAVLATTLCARLPTNNGLIHHEDQLPRSIPGGFAEIPETDRHSGGAQTCGVQTRPDTVYLKTACSIRDHFSHLRSARIEPHPMPRHRHCLPVYHHTL